MSIEWEPVESCPVCGWKGVPSIENFDVEIKEVLYIYFCPRCHSSYHNPRMSMKSIEEYYGSGTYRSNSTRILTPELEKNRQQAIVVKLFMMEPFIKDMKVDVKRSLDYGCGRGLLAKGVQEKYKCEVIGYDLYHDPKAVIDIVDSKDKITGKFDLITCTHVLEHLQHPMEELDWMVSMLNENGVLFIEIPFTRIVFPPHPILFSRDSVFRMMYRINARYMFYDMHYLNDNGIIVAQPNHATLSSIADFDTGKISYFREGERKNDVIGISPIGIGKEMA